MISTKHWYQIGTVYKVSISDWLVKTSIGASLITAPLGFSACPGLKASPNRVLQYTDILSNFQFLMRTGINNCDNGTSCVLKIT